MELVVLLDSGEGILEQLEGGLVLGCGHESAACLLDRPAVDAILNDQPSLGFEGFFHEFGAGAAMPAAIVGVCVVGQDDLGLESENFPGFHLAGFEAMVTVAEDEVEGVSDITKNLLAGGVADSYVSASYNLEKAVLDANVASGVIGDFLAIEGLHEGCCGGSLPDADLEAVLGPCEAQNLVETGNVPPVVMG